MGIPDVTPVNTAQQQSSEHWEQQRVSLLLRNWQIAQLRATHWGDTVIDAHYEPEVAEQDIEIPDDSENPLMNPELNEGFVRPHNNPGVPAKHESDEPVAAAVAAEDEELPDFGEQVQGEQEETEPADETMQQQAAPVPYAAAAVYTPGSPASSNISGNIPNVDPFPKEELAEGSSASGVGTYAAASGATPYVTGGSEAPKLEEQTPIKGEQVP